MTITIIINNKHNVQDIHFVKRESGVDAGCDLRIGGVTATATATGVGATTDTMIASVNGSATRERHNGHTVLCS
jgi:hypothetical protein